MRTLLLTLTTCLCVLPAQAKYSGGSGTAQDPYQIATAADLLALGETPADYDKHFLLTADIDLDPNLPGRKVFDKAVIAPDMDPTKPMFQGNAFTGVFDGNGHTISHLIIKGENYVGLFGCLGSGAEVKDLGVVDVNVAGSIESVGGLVGYNEGSVAQCYSIGAVSGTGSFVGGLVGNNLGSLADCSSTAAVSGNYSIGGLVGHNGGRVSKCSSAGAATGNGGVGGLVGENVEGTVILCYSTAGVSGKNGVGGLVGNNCDEGCSYVADSYSTGVVTGQLCVGGLVGSNGWSVVTRSYSTGAVSGTGNYVGGLVGANDEGTVTHCFWDSQTSGQTTSAGGTGKTTAQMHDPNTFMAAGWGFPPHDIWFEPEGGGYPILWWQLSALPSLPKFSGGAGEPNDPYRILTVKDLNSIGHNPRLMECHFKLVADLDLTGSHFYPIGDADYAYGGVFDGNGHTLSHLTIKGESCLGLFGGLAGEVKNLGVVDVNIAGSGGYVGGLVGENYDGTVTHCYSTGAVSGTGNYVGGLVGENYDGTVTHCYSTGTVSGSDGVGGLVGANGSWHRGGITQCYSTAGVSGRGGVGGLVGYNFWPRGAHYSPPGTVVQCYSTGAVSGNYSVGGLVGDGYSAVTQCFWDTQTSGQAKSWGGMGKTTAEMQTAKTFMAAGWDFVGETKNGTEDLWWILEGKDYPKLWWELIPEN